MMSLKRAFFEPKYLMLVKSAQEFHDRREPTLRIGDRVQLNSGGPIALIVDLNVKTVTVAWNGAEAILPGPCVHRVRD